MFTSNRTRRRGNSILAALLMCTLVLPYARAATCDCHERIADAEHCRMNDVAAVSKASMEHHCDAMMACCLIKLGPTLNGNMGELESAVENAAEVTIPTILSTVTQAPPKPPPRA